ncbi:MAG TPA: NlpC/P60 family protein [Thermoleophilia bacterium]|nr:NlpC/P60 family protein [Thermoleophilia bacterium]
MTGFEATGTWVQRSAAALAAACFAGVLALILLGAAVHPPAAPATPASVQDLEAQARGVRREVSRLDHRAGILTEKYNLARAELDVLNVRLLETRRDLERAQVELETAQALRGARLAAMYKSDGYGVLDVLFSLSDLGEADTQLGYFRSIDEADQETVTRIAAMETRIQALATQTDADRAEALDKEMALREQQAAIEDQLAARETLLADLDARVKKLLAQQAKLDAAASARLARAAGVDLATIHGAPAQIAVVRETMKYLGIPYVWAGATPSGGFDCSGLVLYVYAKFGVVFPHGATMQAHMGKPVSLAQAQPADLVFFGTPAFYHHVGIYIGNGLFIEAPHTGDVVKVSRLAGRGCSLICRYSLSLP